MGEDDESCTQATTQIRLQSYSRLMVTRRCKKIALNMHRKMEEEELLSMIGIAQSNY